MSSNAAITVDVLPGANPAATRALLQDAVDTREAGGLVVLGAGVYEIDGPLRIPGAVTLRAGEGAAVVLSGGRRLALDWAVHGSGVMRADLPADLDVEAMAIDQLYLDDARQHLARYPSFDPAQKFYGGTAQDALSPERIASWADPSGGFVHALHRSKWGGDHWRINGTQADGTLDLEGGWMNNRPSGLHAKERFVENIFEELDAPGEWFVDRNARVLYLYPPEGVDLGRAAVVVSGIEQLIEVIGTSPEQPAGGLRIQGITLAHTARTFMKTNEPLLRSDWMIHRGGAVFIENADDVQVKDCVLRGLGGNGVFVSGYARDVVVKGCHITDAGGSGVCFVGKPEAVRSPAFRYGESVVMEDLDFEPGPATQDYPRDCLVEDSLLHDLGTVEKQVAGVQISMASRVTVRQVSVYDVPRAGINISEGTWGGHVIEGCDVFDTVLMTGDHGSFNAWGRDRFWHPSRDEMDGRTTERPELIALDAVETTTIRNSRWRCDHGWDIDLDDGSSNYEIYNNLCLNGGIKLREGFGRTVRNNIMVNNSFHPHVWFDTSRDVFERNIVTTWYRPIRVEQWGERVDHNLLPDAASLEKSQGLGLDTHGAEGDPQFVDPAAGDFRVRDGSPALSLGFVNFPMDRFGVLKPQLRAVARNPVIPALKINVPPNGEVVETSCFLGASIKKLQGLSERSATGMDSDRGLLVVSVPPHALAHDAGLRTSDVILSVNGAATNAPGDLQTAYLNTQAAQAAFVISRDQTEQPLAIDRGLTVWLSAEKAERRGEGRKPRYNAHKEFLGSWVNPAVSLGWSFESRDAATYDVFVNLAAASSLAGATWALDIAGQAFKGTTPDTGGNETFVRVGVGTVRIDGPGPIWVELKPVSIPGRALMNLRAVELIRR